MPLVQNKPLQAEEIEHMAPEPYHERLRDAKDPAGFRRKVVQFCLEHNRNISLTARTFRTTRKTVRKWLQRFENDPAHGLSDRRGKHTNRPLKTPPHVENWVVQLRQRYPTLGQEKIQVLLFQDHQIHLSSATINRILHAHGLIKARKKRWRQRRELAEKRKRMKIFERCQLDVKHLNDIDNLWYPISRGKMPRYEYTFRDVATGITYVAFAYEVSQTNSMRFVTLVLEHLKAHGIRLQDVSIQTDWGSEFTGPTNAKKRSPVVQLIEDVYGATHTTIPPATPRFNGAVENFHGRIEDELYRVETFSGEADLLAKSSTYLLYYHFRRPHLGLRDENAKALTPFNFTTQYQLPNASPALFFLPPTILDRLPATPLELLQPHKTSGDNIPDHVNFALVGLEQHFSDPSRRAEIPVDLERRVGVEQIRVNATTPLSGLHDP